MILARSTFQVKFGHMDAILAFVKEAYEDGPMAGQEGRVLTDASGQMFTLIFETKAESVDAYMEELQAGFEDPQAAAFMEKLMQHVESGSREFLNIEWES